MDEELGKIQSALSEVLGSYEEGSSIFFVGSTTAWRGNLFVPGLSDIDLLVVPRCDTLKEYEVWLENVAKIHRELNQASSQLYDVFILSSHIADLHFACLTSIGSPLPGEHELVDKKYSAVQLTKPHLSAELRINIYRAMLRRMTEKSWNLLPVADTGQSRKIVKYLRKLTKVAICSYAKQEDIDELEENLLALNNLTSLAQCLGDTSFRGVSFDDIFQSVLDGHRVSDWSAWMVAQEKMIPWLTQLEKGLPAQNVKEARLYDGIVKVTLMLLMDVKTVLGETNESQEKEIGKFADDAAGVLVQLALSGVDPLVDFTTAQTPQRVKESYEILIKHLEDDRSNMQCFAASVILLEYALECSTVERSK